MEIPTKSPDSMQCLSKFQLPVFVEIDYLALKFIYQCKEHNQPKIFVKELGWKGHTFPISNTKQLVSDLTSMRKDIQMDLRVQTNLTEL